MMKFHKFRELVKEYPFFSWNIVQAITPGDTYTLKQLSLRETKWYIIRIKRWRYVLSPEYRTQPLSLRALSNDMVFPSYVSLESALSYWSMIPEAVYAITAITTLKTQTYTNPLGVFTYRSMTHKLYGWFTHREWCLIAIPEKALVDRLWYQKKDKRTHGILESMRIEIPQWFDLQQATGFVIRSENKAFLRRWNTFIVPYVSWLHT